MSACRIEPVEPGAAVAERLLREYLYDILARYPGARPGADLCAAVTDELADPRNTRLTVVLVATDPSGEPAGCVGLREDVGAPEDPEAAELKRLYVRPAWRGTGLGEQLVTAAERHARERFGARLLRLDTRADLTEARALYRKLGYHETPAYGANPYADHWFAKPL